MFSSKKKATPAPAAPVSSKADPKAAERLFDSLVDPDDPDTMYMDGISKLCENLGMDPAADVRVLVMLWKLGAVSKPGSITRSEFLSGFQKLQVSDTERLKTMVPSFDPGFMDKSEFRGTVQFTPRHTFCAELTSAALRRVQISTSSYFSFHGRGRIRPLVSKMSSESRPMSTVYNSPLSTPIVSTEKEIIIALLPIVLDKNRAPHLSHFLQFLESCSHQRITLDQWDSFLQFNHAVNADLSNLEEDGACKTGARCDDVAFSCSAFLECRALADCAPWTVIGAAVIPCCA
jgi:hypothetical protein